MTEMKGRMMNPRVCSESDTGSNVHLNELLDHVLIEDASDLHVTVGVPPTIRVHGDLRRLDQYAPLNPEQLRRMIYSILTQRQRERFEQDLELDLSYVLPGKARFRVNVYS